VLWLFVILGIVGLVSALSGIARGLEARRGLVRPATSIALFAAAWAFSHESLWGWVSMLAGILLESVRRIVLAMSGGRAATSPATTETVKPPAVELPRPAPLDPSPPAPARENAKDETRGPSPPMLTSHVLLRESWHLAPAAFLASLRRVGERRIEAVETGETLDEADFRVEQISLRLRYEAAPVGARELEEAASQSWDWPDALGNTSRHLARVAICTSVPKYGDARGDEPSCEQVLRLHTRAQMALAEFAPVVAIHWPSSRRLVSPTSLPQSLATSGALDLARATCLVFRGFPLTGEEHGSFLCDTVGLHSFGLADAELVRAGEPDSSISDALHQYARESLETPSRRLSDFPSPPDRFGQWTLRRADARFPPARMVLRFKPPA